MTIDATWHRRHRMPRNPTDAQRIAWHLAHQARCACRPVPAGVLALLTHRPPPPSSPEAVERFFHGRPAARRIFTTVERAVRAAGASTRRVTKAQIAFRCERAFAWAWTPDRWLVGRTAPLVLSIALPRRDLSPRWKQVTRPIGGRWTHHLELRSSRDVDATVRAWLAEARTAARPRAAAPPDAAVRALHRPR